MKENILDFISQHGKTTLKTLVDEFGINSSTLENILLELKLDGKIFEISNRYSLLPDSVLVGEISMTKSGNKVIFYDGKPISVSSNFFDHVIMNDAVNFTINEHGEADIISIIERRIKDVTCKVVVNGKKKKLECFHNGIEIKLSEDVMKNLSNGDIILVSIGINNIDSGYCESTFKRIVGHVSDPNIDDITIAFNYGFGNDYSDEYLEEINKIPTYVRNIDLVKRTDYRHLPFFTMDCVTAKDLDDAIYGEKLDDGTYIAYVSISDVSHYVKITSEIFKRAFLKGNSCYINNSVFHMLHEILANGICSLNPSEDRLTKTVIMHIDKDGKILDFNICKSVINSRKKMDYDSVDRLLVDGIVSEGYEPFVDNIKVVHEIAMLFEKRAIFVDGKINFPSDELEKEYDENGKIISTKEVVDTPAKKLIEYFMISANKCVASYIFNSFMPGSYRVHRGPNVYKINVALKEINNSLIESGEQRYKFKMIDSAKEPKVIQAILKKISNLEEYPILATILLQYMERAEYSVENIGHYALGIDIYTHFTSPIRRLCDLVIHTILDILLDDFDLVDGLDYEKLEEFLEEMCKQASFMERQADAAEIAGERLAIVKSMKDHIGEEYDAVVLEANQNLRVKVNGIDCFVKYKSLSDDFEYDENEDKYYDRNNNMYLKMGAKVKVVLKSVNLTNRTIVVDIVGIISSKKLIKNNRKKRCVV